MTRSEYLLTMRGQKHESRKRSLNLLYLCVKQEPKSKKAINSKEKKQFRAAVYSQLKKQNRKAFRGHIILQLDFFVTEKNPPSIQNLCKNYLDLLHKPMPEIDQLEGILFKDDSEVKILIANYHSKYFDSNGPSIEIRAYRLSHFFKDIEFVEGISENRFKHKSFNSFDHYEEREEFYSNDLFDELIEWKNSSSKYSEIFGAVFYKFWLNQLTRSVQEQFLQRNKFSLRHIMMIGKGSFGYNKRYHSDPFFQNLWSNTENMIFMALSQVELTGVPLIEGGTKSFKSDLEVKLTKFKEKYSVLFPLLHPISLMVFYTPPKRNRLDLDNLAKYMIPLITEIFNPPPMDETFKIDFNFADADNELKIKKSLTQNKITNYQILYRKRKEDTPDEGIVNILITDGMKSHNNIWNTISDFIRKYDEGY